MYERIIEFPKKLSFFLFGPRQTGKSTLIINTFTDNIWKINLLHNEEFLTYSKEPQRIRKEAEYKIESENINTIFIDEVQRIPVLLNEIHSLIEKFPECRFILTGSSARKLKRNDVNLLAGRAVEKFLFPLTFHELEKEFDLSEILTFGSLPSVYGRDAEEKILILRTYVNTYLREEIQSEGIARNIGSFSLFLDIAAAQFGEQVNYSAIGRECQISSKLVQSYYEILEDTLVGFRLMPWKKSVRKRLSLQPKFYFFDIGVTNALNRHLSEPPDPSLKGRLFELFILLEVRALISYKGSECQIFFWRTSHGAEVDLVIERHGKILAAVEIKSLQSISGSHLKGLRSFREEHTDVRLIVACDIKNAYMLDGVDILPWRKFLSELENIV